MPFKQIVLMEIHVAEIVFEHSTGCISSMIIFKYGMKVHYGNVKLSIAVAVGGGKDTVTMMVTGGCFFF